MSDSAPGSEVESDGEPRFRRFDQLAGRELIFSYQESPGGTWELRHCQELVGTGGCPGRR